MAITLKANVRWGGVDYAPGATIPGLTPSDEAGLVASNRAEWVGTPSTTSNAAVPVMATTGPGGGNRLSGNGTDYIAYNYDVVVVLVGQSNADGRGDLLVDSPMSPAALCYAKTEEVLPLCEPAGKTGAGWTNNIPAAFDESTRSTLASAAAHSPATAFGREFLRATGMRPLVIPCAIGSTGFTHWTPPATEDDPKSLFGAATLRAKKALRPGVPLIVWLVGHEADADMVDWNLSTGAAGASYTTKFREYAAAWRTRFPDCWLLYGQLGGRTSADAALQHCVAGDGQRRVETDFNSAEPSGAYLPAQSPNFSNLATLATNATNTATLTGMLMRVVSDAGSAVGFSFGEVRHGRTYRIKVVAAGTGTWKLMAYAQKGGSYAAGTHTITFTADALNTLVSETAQIRIVRNTACDLTFDLSKMTIEEDVENFSFWRKVMFCTYDLPLKSDGIHFTQQSADVLGERAAKAAAERIYKISAVTGTGPRLVSVTKTSATQIKIKFDREIQENLNGYGASVAASLFRVYHNGGLELDLSACVRDTGDSTAVLLTTASAYSGTVCVTYGARAAVAGQYLAGCVYDADGLPAPMFMQVAVAA